MSVRFLKKLAIHVTIAFFEIFKGIRGHSLVILNKKMLCFGNCSCLFQNMVDWSVSCCRPFMYRRIVTIADGRSGYAVLVCNNERRGKLCINDQRGKQLNVRRKFREVCSTDRSSMLIPTRILIKPSPLRILFNCNRSTLTIS